MKTTKLISTLAVAAFIMTINSAWAMEQDTGYPWFGDLTEKEQSTVSPNGKVVVTPVVPAGEDMGYPWFADIKEDRKAIEKPITIFKLHPRSVEEDSGYPWNTEIENNG